MKLRVCFTLAKYENDMMSLCETTNVFIDGFCYSKIHFYQLGSLKLIKTMLQSLNVCKAISKAPYCSIIVNDEFKDRICKE